MAYKDCPCLNCKDRSHGSKRVACQTGCEKYLSWKAKEQELRRKEKNYMCWDYFIKNIRGKLSKI